MGLFPTAPEGELTRRRADMVCETALAAIAVEIDLGPALRLGRGEDKSGGRDKPRLLASSLEACVGAVWVDGGMAAAMAVARRLFEARIRYTTPGARDYKSRVQEHLQAARGHTPRYVLLDTEGPDHERHFHVAIVDGETSLAEGRGRSKLEAEQEAARTALEQVRGEPGGTEEG